MATEQTETLGVVAAPAAEERLPKAALWIVMLAALLCFGSHTGRPNFQTHDELFYMTGALAASETGDWLIPTYHGDVRLKKPPLQYWLVGISYRLFGVGAWQGRLPTVLAGVAAVGLVYWLIICISRSTRCR